jgi:hypothetical protein
MAEEKLIASLAATVVEAAQNEAPVKTGALKRSIKVLSLTENEAMVGHDYNEPALITDKYEKIIYPIFVHEGTGPYVIKPKEKKALAWGKGGNKIIRKKVSHPGIKPQPYFDEALKSPKIDEVISQYGDEMIKDIALSLEKKFK